MKPVNWDAVKPITPDEVVDQKESQIPDQVIAIWNALIAREWDGSRACVLQQDAYEAICDAMFCDKSKVFDEGWLDIEEMYRKAGWHVAYDKPGYNETYKANFTFTKGRR